MTILQDFVDKLVPLQTEINEKTDEGLKQSAALAILENEIEDLVSQRGVIETEAAGAGIAVSDLQTAVMDAITAPKAEAEPVTLHAGGIMFVEQPAAEEAASPATAEPVEQANA